MRGGIIMALDMGVTLGVAIGGPGAIPRSYSVRLKKPSQDGAMAMANLVAFLHAEFTKTRPALLVKEAPPALQGFANMGNAERTVRLTYGLHGVAEAMATRFGVPWHEVHDATARKHFLGRGRLGSRSETKAAVIARCHLLGFFAKTVTNEDRADACCVWDWACATLARTAPRDLHLFGERAA